MQGCGVGAVGLFSFWFVALMQQQSDKVVDYISSQKRVQKRRLPFEVMMRDVFAPNVSGTVLHLSSSLTHQRTRTKGSAVPSGSEDSSLMLFSKACQHVLSLAMSCFEADGRGCILLRLVGSHACGVRASGMVFCASRCFPALVVQGRLEIAKRNTIGVIRGLFLRACPSH